MHANWRRPVTAMDGNFDRESREIPERLGAYQILRKIGEGGMGIVYEGVRLGSSERVAIKTVSANDRRLLVALRAEVVALRQIRHPSVVAILDEGLSERPPWYAM